MQTCHRGHWFSPVIVYSAIRDEITAAIVAASERGTDFETGQPEFESPKIENNVEGYETRRLRGVVRTRFDSFSSSISD